MEDTKKMESDASNLTSMTKIFTDISYPIFLKMNQVRIPLRIDL